MGNSAARAGVPNGSESATYSDYDENTINRGTFNRPKPLLKFHSVHGTNVTLFNDGKIARRKESFCKGLVFSNRPITVDEIVCLRLCDVGTNWSGVLRFGVTNVDPASFRDIELPKFACPDLTSKPGYWAKALAERYSVEKSILHFFVNSEGEMYYGINGVSKGLFLNGINVSLPIWIIIDIYGNSVGVEFVDPADVHLRSAKNLRAKRNKTPPFSSSSRNEESTSAITVSAGDTATPSPSMTSSTSANNLGLTAAASEYYLGYVFTDRPVKIDEKIVVMILQVEEAFSGSLAFGLTSCDPTQVPASRLPVDSDELLERPEYWVCIKDVGAMPAAGDRMSFSLDSAGQVLFSKNDAPSRVIMHVDISIPLWAFFDLYGTTRKIQLLDHSITSGLESMRNYRASSEGCSTITRPSDSSHTETTSGLQRTTRPASTGFNLDSLRVVLPPETSTASGSPHSRRRVTAELPITYAPTIFTISPSSSSSAPIGLDSTELNRLRSIANRLNFSERPTTSPLTIERSSAGDGEISGRSPLSEFRYRRNHHTTSHAPSVSPARGSPADPSYVPNTRNTFADIFENNSVTSSTPPASITVPLLPPPLVSSLITSATNSRSEPTRVNNLSGSRPQPIRSRAAHIENTNSESSSESPPAGNDQNGAGSECSICMNSRVNAVIYRCGHMCMCFACAKETHRRSGDCPICRTPIIDVIRCYPA
ncbi:neuralized domain-containing protein [Ditylenchus destructor]|uniref:Neuralized domain-containing protein n=1 Tax=Ditylenchus destructor TaxID=166010 RepID=A0AAD4NAH6_9BILA|nr:neuralized domain-containing protein [Ditylenchus destructor]